MCGGGQMELWRGIHFDFKFRILHTSVVDIMYIIFIFYTCDIPVAPSSFPHPCLLMASKLKGKWILGARLSVQQRYGIGALFLTTQGKGTERGTTPPFPHPCPLMASAAVRGRQHLGSRLSVRYRCVILDNSGEGEWAKKHNARSVQNDMD